MTDMFGTKLKIGDKIIFSKFITSDPKQHIIQPKLRTGVISKIENDTCYVPNGRNFLTLRSEHIVKHEFPYEIED